MLDAVKPTERPSLERLLEELDITVFESKDGTYTVYTTCEPLFCYQAASLDAIEGFVRDTLASYARIFYHTEAAIVWTDREDIPQLLVPTERVTPISKLRSRLGGSAQGQRHEAHV